MRDQCAQVGPRGGRCRRLQEHTLDFCAKHNQEYRDGKLLHCLKCDQEIDGERS